jgi:pyruvate formate lyase activating enzyme
MKTSGPVADTLPPIKGFLPSSLIEWEGKVAAAVFLPGCNFRCPFCHATDLVLGADKLNTIPFDAVARHLEANRGWIDGVVLSGGEPTLHAGLAHLIEALRTLVPGIKLDSNGASPEALDALVQKGLIDFVSMDVKAPLGEAYQRATGGVGVDCADIQRSIALLRDGGIGHEFRTTVVPGLHTQADVVAIARLLGPGERLVLQQFAPLNCLDPSLNERKPYGRDALRDMARAAAEHVASCHLRGEQASQLPAAEAGRTPS